VLFESIGEFRKEGFKNSTSRTITENSAKEKYYSKRTGIDRQIYAAISVWISFTDTVIFLYIIVLQEASLLPRVTMVEACAAFTLQFDVFLQTFNVLYSCNMKITHPVNTNSGIKLM